MGLALMLFPNSVFPNCRAKYALSLQLQNIRNAYNIQIRFFKMDQFFMTKVISNGMKTAIVDHTKHSPQYPVSYRGQKEVFRQVYQNSAHHFQQILTHFPKISNLCNDNEFLCHKLSQHLQLFTFSTRLMCFNSREANVLLKVWINLQIKSPSSIAAHSCI